MADGIASPVRVGEEPERILSRALEDASTFVKSSTALVSVALHVPPGKPSNLIGLWPDRPFFAHGEQVGLGAAAHLELDRFDVAQAKAWAEDVLARNEGVRTPPIFCGSGFDPRSVRSLRWSTFPAFAMLLPRWHYRQDRGNAELTLTLPVDRRGQRVNRDEALVELSELLECLEHRLDFPAPPRVARRVEMPEADWSELVTAARGQIAAGRFRKVVLARSTLLEADALWNARDVFSKLREADGTTFALRFGNATFLGATPETLIEGQNGQFVTHALAGTAAASADPASLLTSKKDAEEHQIVVDEILARLRPLAAELVSAPHPSARRLRDVIHLQTSISIRATPSARLLDLAHALHPTPAVGGLPREAAVDWICASEREPRGWYAGFVGYIHRTGGAFSVAIRSGLLSGREAVLYAGAGIVADSDPAAEYRETSWKQRPFLRALGLDA